uniref:Uncharacterized protein n=1 Tax=Zooxanthella nutricula TaxID=1333877 RepID=A0A7S2JJY3_9DINO|mmetsp:Transcript_31459/g.95086  ORF Transcript_31459/g.95086 Transcript_31459/m.95086 type:complete len:152 (+) Transcript_31459:92-547(+)
MSGQDGDEWMVFSDAMRMGRFNSIMDSSLVFSPFVLLFADALMVDEKKNEIRFDKWYAYIEQGAWIKELLDLRKQIFPAFKECIEARDLSQYPPELVSRIAKFVCRNPIKLAKVEACSRKIDEEVSGAMQKHVSKFEWPKDDGPEEEDDEQ